MKLRIDPVSAVRMIHPGNMRYTALHGWMRKLRIIILLEFMRCTVVVVIPVEEDFIKLLADKELKRIEQCAQSNTIDTQDLRGFRVDLIDAFRSLDEKQGLQGRKRLGILSVPGMSDSLKMVAEKISDDNSEKQMAGIVESYIKDLEAEAAFYRKLKIDHGVYILSQYIPLTCSQRAWLESYGYCEGKDFEQLIHWATNIIHTHVGSILPFIIDSEVGNMFGPEQNEMMHLLGRSTASSGLQLFLPVVNFNEVSLTYHVSSIVPDSGMTQVEGIYSDIIRQLFRTYSGLWEKEFELSEDWRRRFELAGLQSYRQFAFRMSDPESRLGAYGSEWVLDVNLPFTHVLVNQSIWMKMVDKSSRFLVENGSEPVNTPANEMKDYMNLCGRMNIYHVLHEQVLSGAGGGKPDFISGRQLTQLYTAMALKLFSGEMERPVRGFPDHTLQNELIRSCQVELDAIFNRDSGNLIEGDAREDR